MYLCSRAGLILSKYHKGNMPERNVYLFVPNIIGYMRVFCLVVSCYYMKTSPWLAMALYMTNVHLDELDGRVARRLKQTSMYGALLDMITDRFGSACLMVVLAHLYSTYIAVFQLLIVLDVAGHWVYLHSIALKGLSSHKQGSSNIFMQFYYTPPTMDILWYSNEVFLCSLYLSYFSPGLMIPFFSLEVGLWNLLALISLPFFATKQFFHIVKIMVGFQAIAALDSLEMEKQNGIPVPTINASTSIKKHS